MNNHIEDEYEQEEEHKRLYPEAHLNIPQSNYSDEMIDELDEDQTVLEGMDDVDLRIAELTCYKALLENTFFEEGSPVARLVENKVRDFIKNEIRELLGMTQAKEAVVQYKSPFSPEQEEALKEISARLIEKKNAMNGVPTVSPVQAVKPTIEAPRVNPARMSPAPKPNVVKKPRTPKVAVQAPQPQRQPRKKKEELLKREMTMPDGSVHMVTINPRAQTKPPDNIPGRIPAMSAQHIADAAGMQAQHQVLSQSPQSGILGLAVRAAEAGLIRGATEE